MKNAFAFGATTAAAVTVSLLTASPTFAQAPPAQPSADTGGLEEVVVTARYRQENLQQTPIAITAITAQDISERGFENAAEIAYTVPNASFRPAQAAFGNTMTAFIRGIGQNDFLPEFEPGVGIYFDDVLYPVTMGSMIDLMDLERVEVLRGPQGTLFGRGSIGGAVRYVSKKPQGDNTGQISLTYGRFDRLDVRGTYDFALADNLYVRATGVSKQMDGYQDVYDFACINPGQAGTLPVLTPNRNSGCKLGTQGGTDVTGARLSMRYVASDNLEFSLTGDYLNDASPVRADTLVGVTGPDGAFQVWSDHYLLPTYGVQFDSRFVPNNRFVSYATYMDPKSGLAFNPTTSLRQDGVSGKMDWKVSDAVRAELIGSYREFEGRFSTDADQSPVNEQTVDGHPLFNSRSGELRLSGRMFDRADWTVGAFVYNGHFHNAQVVSIPALIFAGVYGDVFSSIAGTPQSTDPAVLAAANAAAEAAGADVINNAAKFLVNGNNITDSENRSAFAHVVFDLTEKLSITGGIRESKDIKNERFDNTIVVTSLDTDEDHFDWKLGLDYKFTDAILGYVSAATGYRPQSFNPRPFQRTQFVQVDGEEAKSYELGMKADFLERRLRVNAAAFYIDYGQRIVPIGGVECLLSPLDPGSGPPVYDTVAPGTPDSITDALGNVCLDTRTTSRTFYQNSPGKISGGELEIAFRPIDPLMITGSYGYTHFTADDLDQPGVVINRPAYVPQSNWTVGGSYQFGFSGGSTLTPRVDVYGQSEICTGVTSFASCSDGYELVNARLEWGSPEKTWTVAFGANNVTNEDYFYNKFDLSAFGQPTTEGQPGAPREWYVAFTRNF
jgi:iron complex outermembrane receptor protein